MRGYRNAVAERDGRSDTVAQYEIAAAGKETEKKKNNPGRQIIGATKMQL